MDGVPDMTDYLRDHWKTVGIGAVIVAAAYAYYFLGDSAKAVSILEFSWRFAIPLVLAAMVGIVGERSGIVNIGIEGQMLTAAFAGFFGATATGSIWLGALIGSMAGMLMGFFLAWVSVQWQMDQVIAGVVINIIATGLTSFYYVPGEVLPGSMPKLSVPVLSDIPLIGPVFFERGAIGLLTLVLVFAIHYALFHTRWGLRTRAIGEHPNAADTAGINVINMRLVNVTFAGLLAGLAGAYLALEATGTFIRGMTAGRGFLALAIMIFGAWYPNRALAAALFFGFASGLASQLQADEVVAIPPQLVNLLAPLLTLTVLAVAAGKMRPPAAEGQPFVKGSA